MAFVLVGPLCLGFVAGAVLLVTNEESAVPCLVGGAGGGPASGDVSSISFGVTFLLTCVTATLAGTLLSSVRPHLLRLLMPPGLACRPFLKAGHGKRPAAFADDDVSTECSEGSDGEWFAESKFSSRSRSSMGSPVGSPAASDAAESRSVQQRPRLFGDVPESERAMRRVKAMLNKMTIDSFEKLTAQLVQEAEDSVAADHHRQFVESLAAELVAKGTTEKGFIGLYADAMVELHKALAGLGVGSELVFMEAVEDRCRCLLERYLASPAVDEDLSVEEKFEDYLKHKTMMLGNAALIGELAMRSLIAPERAFSFARRLFEERAEMTLETLCMLLRTVRRGAGGASCRDHPEFEALFRDVTPLVDDLSLSFRTRCVLKELIEERDEPPTEPVANGRHGTRRRRGVGAKEEEPRTGADHDIPKWLYEPVKTSRIGGRCVSRIPVGIETDPDFQVVRRLIGRGGTNMKAIVAVVSGAKLRVRGRGSGYLEGPDEQEADEPLMVCVSCPTTQSLYAANCQVQELLRKLHKDYAWFRARRAG